MSEPTQAEKDAMYATALKTIAEQREQLDAARQQVSDALQEMEQARQSHEVTLGELDAAQQQIALVREVLNKDLKISSERVLTLEIENQHLQQQIATLTEERDEAKKYAAQFMMPTADFENAVILAQREQIATLKARIATLETLK